MGLAKKLAYAAKVLPGATWRSIGSVPRGPVHLIIMMADHFEPAIDPSDGLKRAPRSEQERRLEWWNREYPQAADRWRADGFPALRPSYGRTKDRNFAEITLAGDRGISIFSF